MKKTGVILTAVILLCVILVSCGADDGVLPSDSTGTDTSTVAPVTTPIGEVDAIVPQSAEQTEELVFEYLSALPTVGEQTPEPQILVVQSYDQLRAVYEAADACEDDEMGVKGSWENIGSSDKFYQTYFDKHFAVVVLMVTDDGYYDLRLDCEDSEEGISLNVFGVRSYEQPTIRERHVFFCGFEGKYEGQSISLDVGYTPFASQVEQNIYTYLSYDEDRDIPSKPYFVVQSYEELLEVYAYATERPSDFGSYSLGIKGNWSEANKNNLYNEQFFENIYIVVAMTQTSSGSYTFTSSAEMVDGEIVVTLNGTCPAVFTDDIGSYLFVCPMQGEYGGESINIVRNTERETWTPEYILP
jgi:hypothetical protein